MYLQDTCPSCCSTKLVKNGNTYYGKTRLKCKDCHRQFVEKRTYAPLSNECKRRIELLLAERLSLEAICRVMEIEPHRLYAYMDELYDEIPEDLACSIPDCADIDMVKVDCEADELWSFVGRKSNKKWLWLALDRNSRQVVALFVGDRSEDGARGLWEALPEGYRERATFYTDDWAAYKKVIPAERHRFRKSKKDTAPAARQPCGEVLLHAQAAMFQTGSAKSFFFKKTRSARQINQVRHHPLQPIITILGLPVIKRKSRNL